MSDRQSFRPQGNTVRIDVTSTPSTPIKIQDHTAGPISEQVRVVNAGPNTAYIVFGSAAADSTGSSIVAAIPAVGTPANAYPMLSGTIETFSYNPQGYIAAVTAGSDTAALYITPGEGL